MVDLSVELMIYSKVNIVPAWIPVKEVIKIKCLRCSYSNIPSSILASVLVACTAVVWHCLC